MIKSDKTYQEYIYRVLEITSYADIELEDKIQYISLTECRIMKQASRTGAKQGRRCYNCGDKDHLGSECRNEQNVFLVMSMDTQNLVLRNRKIHVLQVQKVHTCDVML